MSTSKTITRTDLTNILNDILPVYNSTGFTVEKFTASSATSVSANGGTAWIQVRIPSGYEPVCVIGYYLNGGSGCSVYNESLSSDSNGYYASFALRNGQSTANSVTIDAFVLCKQSLTHFTQAMADYIVEQGTSGIWTYRKWNSGIAECWGTTRFTNAPMTSAWGYGYYSSSVGRSIALPSPLFTSVISASVGADFHGGTGNWSIEGIGSTTAIGGYLWSTKSETRTVDVCLEVKGRWK